MAISDEWVNWTRSNLKTGVAVEEIREALSKKGFSDKDIKYALKKSLPRRDYQRSVKSGAAVIGGNGTTRSTDYTALAEPKLTRDINGRTTVALCESELQLITLPGFLDKRRCDALIEIIRANAHPSRIDGYREETALRSSHTCAMTVRDHPLVGELNDAIALRLGINPRWSEVCQGQWYAPGQEYKPHLDYFPPGAPEYAHFINSQGQRTWTFMIYLNSTEQGGGTFFTKIGRTVNPEQGRAVCWNNLLRNGEPNPNSEHAGLPVERGEKFIITKWFRDRGEGDPLLP